MSIMLDWQGNMVDPRDCQTINLIDIEEDADVASTTYVGSVEEQAIITLLDNPSHVLNDKDLAIPVVQWKHLRWTVFSIQ